MSSSAQSHGPRHGQALRGGVLACLLTTLLTLTSPGPAPANDVASAPATDMSSAYPGPGRTQSCVGPRSLARRAVIAWSSLHNPILSFPATAAKDEALRLWQGQWRMFFSSVAANPERWRIGTSTSADLRDWSHLSLVPAQPGVHDEASPDLVRSPSGSFVLTYQATPNGAGNQAKIFYRTSLDLSHWSEPRRLAANLHTAPGDRLIDAALAFTSHGVVLGYKYGLPGGLQAFEIAYSPGGSLDGPWQLVGRPDIRVFGDTVENYEFLVIDGTWRLLATSNQLDRPWLFRLDGPPALPASWLSWTGGYQLQVPGEAWNTAPGLTGSDYELDNSAYLCDARSVDGHFYLLYAGSSELTAFGGWGHAAIGVARSTDLANWEVPPG